MSAERRIDAKDTGRTQVEGAQPNTIYTGQAPMLNEDPGNVEGRSATLFLNKPGRHRSW